MIQDFLLNLNPHNRSLIEQLFVNMFGSMPICFEEPLCINCGKVEGTKKFTGWLWYGISGFDVLTCSVCFKLLSSSQEFYYVNTMKFISLALQAIQNEPKFDVKIEVTDKKLN